MQIGDSYESVGSEDVLAVQIGCMSVFKISLYIYLYNVFHNRFRSYMTIIVFFTRPLTSVFLLFLPTLANVYIWR
jgi:hypothetical protein